MQQSPEGSKYNAHRKQPLLLLVAAAYAIVAAVISILIVHHLGKSIGFDTLNYEFSSGYSVIHGFGGSFSLPGQVQTYLDAELNGLYYLLIAHLSAFGANAAIATIESLSSSLLATMIFFLARAQFGGVIVPVLAGSVSGAAALVSPNYISELGATYGDTVTSLPLVAAFAILWVVLFGAPSTTRFRYLCSSIGGVLLGAAVGLKFTSYVYAIGIAGAFVVVLLLSPSPRGAPHYARLRTIICVGSAALVTAAAFLLPLALLLNHRYGDPLFPFYGGTFRSTFLTPSNFYGTNYLPRNALGLTTKTWALFTGSGGSMSELEVRSPLLFGCLVVVAAFFLYDLIHRRSRPSLYIEIAVLSSYVLWGYRFGYYRYLAPVEVTACAAVLALVIQSRWLPRKTLILIMAMLVAIAPTQSLYANWQRATFNGPYFGVTSAQVAKLVTRHVLLLGYAPTGYLYPYLPKNTEVVRLGGNLTAVFNDRWWRLMGEDIRSKNTAWTAVFQAGDEAEVDSNLGLAGLTHRLSDCRVIPPTATNLPYEFCMTERFAP